MGFSLRRMLRNPFGKHSLFGKATQIASVLPIPFAGLAGKAFRLLNRGKTAYDALQGRVGPVLTAASALVPATAPSGVMPGGARVPGKPAVHRTRRRSKRRRSKRTHKRRR